MRKRIVCFLFFIVSLLPHRTWAQEATRLSALAASYSATVFLLVHNAQAASIYIDIQDVEVAHVAAESLAKDIASVTGAVPTIPSAAEKTAERLNEQQPPQLVDFHTVGRSAEWKENVLRNSAIRQVRFAQLRPGRHTPRPTFSTPAWCSTA